MEPYYALPSEMFATIRAKITDEKDRQEWDATVKRYENDETTPAETLANTLILIGLFPGSTEADGRDIPALLATAEARKYMVYKAGRVLLSLSEILNHYYAAIEDHRSELLTLSKMKLEPQAAKLVADMRESLDRIHDMVASFPNPEKAANERFRRLGTPAADAYMKHLAAKYGKMNGSNV